MVKPLVLAIGLALVCASAPAVTMSVQVQTTQVRATPSYLGDVLASLGYAEAVETLETRGAWTQVRTAAGQVGWVNQSALTPKRLALKAGAAAGETGASSDELALANKGFNSDVEAQFKTAHAEIDFTWVDKMGTMTIAPTELTRFIRVGGLKSIGGGAQ